MKGSLACMLSAASKYEASQFQRPLYIICTADEEVGYRGALQVVKRSKYYRELVQDQVRGIIGEPTSLEVVHAHKGVAGFRATSHGRAAHSSTSKGLNANLAMIPFLVEMKEIHDELVREPRWQHPEFDPPGMCWNIGINDFTTATNITPPRSVCTIGFRPVPGADVDLLADRVAAAAHRHGIELQTTVRFPPLYVPKDHPFVKEMLEIAGQQIPKTVGYGTDGATFTELSRLVVFGPGDIAQAHTDDEWISLDQLNRGVELYARCLEQFCLERA